MSVRSFVPLGLLFAVYASGHLFAQGPMANPWGGTRPVSVQPVAPAQVAKYVMNSREFDIPVSIDQTGARPSEVRLYVSRDQGRQWNVAARVEPSSRQFQFTAPEDGAYWFATRTLDATGRTYPPGNQISPQLVVVVDTSKPQLDLQADADAAGGIEVNFSVADESLVSTGVQIYYMVDTDQQQWVSVDPNLSGASRDSSGGINQRVRIQPRNDWRYLNLRMVVTDQAGNQSAVTKQVERPRVAQVPVPGVRQGGGFAGTPAAPVSTSLGSQFPQQGQGDSGYSLSVPEPGLRSQLSAGAGMEGASRMQAGEPPVDGSSRGVISGGVSSSLGPGVQGNSALWTVTPPKADYASGPSNALYRGMRPPMSGGTAGARGGQLGTPAQPASRSEQESLTGPNLAAPNNSEIRRSPTSAAMQPMVIETLPVPMGVADPGIDAVSANAERGASDGNLAPNLLEVQERSGGARAEALESEVDFENVRFTRLNRFELNYEVESVGAQGVSAVELWGTRDGGETWTNWGRDQDNQTPFDVETTGSGLYGFWIVVVGKNGLTSALPRSGDPAEISVLVDTEAPLVHITAVRYGEGAEAGSLIIEYKCEDEYLTVRPISLSYGADAAGPWTTIATGLENSGRFAWQADPRLPRSVYLRIEAVDRAGNVGIESTTRPIAAHGLAPRARIRGFQSIE